MKKRLCLAGMTAFVAALILTGSAYAASDCLQLELSAPASVCAGQSATVTASVTNSCTTREQVNAGFTLDGQPVPVRAHFGVAADSTLSKSMSFPIPASATAGSHTLVVTLTDAAGGTVSASVDLSVSSCSAR